jgi:ribosomal protein L11 methyltransferase
VLRVPAARAFGTGEHASTRLVLIALQEEMVEGLSVLDVGTGSGILSLAAASLGARRVVACDVDTDALFIARENLRLHSFGSLVRLVASSTDALGGNFDLVLANLLPQEFLPARRSILARVAPGGRLLLSGIPIEAEPDVIHQTRARRWRLAGRRVEEGWACLCLERA